MSGGVQDQPEKAWWQACSLDEFEAAVKQMPVREIDALVLEIGARISAVTSQVEDTTRDDLEWLGRAKRALGHMTERRRIARAEVTRRNETSRGSNYARKKRVVDAARKALESGDVAGAVKILIDLADPDVPLPNLKDDAKG
jgi:hypothetical protein